MTLIFDSKRTAPSTHAFVIGVADYPFAKPDLGTNPKLQQVRDLPSAADSAKRMVDWLIENKERLVPPLGTIELLLSDLDGGAPRYVPRATELHSADVKRANQETIPAAGNAWLSRLRKSLGSRAFFYGCGHGANYGTRPVLFHSGLNEREQGLSYGHLNVGLMAQAFRQRQDLSAGFFFLDACGEFVRDFPPDVRDDGFVSPGLPTNTDRDKVWLLSGASAALLAYPGIDIDSPDPLEFDAATDPPDTSLNADPNQGVKLGRFTQTLIKGLDGASARWNGDGWSVDNMGLWSDLRLLHRAYFPSWRDKPFEPSEYLTPNDRFSIVTHENPRFPVLVSVEPTKLTAQFDLKIGLAHNGAGDPVDFREVRGSDPWLAHVYGDRTRPYYALALNGTDPCKSSFFKAEQPHFDQRVPLV